MTLTKNEIIERITEVGFSKKQSAELFKTLLEIIKNSLDGFVKSPISALRCIPAEFHVRLTTLHSSGFARLDLELFTLPSQN